MSKEKELAAGSTAKRRLISRRHALGTLAVGTGALLAAPRISTALASPEQTVTEQQANGPMLGRLGIDLSHEQFPAPQLAEWGVQAEQAGFANIWVSDHFQPWQDNQGHSGYARVTQAVMGQRTKKVAIGTSVTCPTYRYNPAEIAQAFATLAQFTPGRVMIGVGSGEALNENAATGQWGNYAERSARLIEAVTLMRQLWSGQPVDYKGQYYQVKARLYDMPPAPIPIFIAATGPKSMRLAGQYGDGLITSADIIQKAELRQAFAEGARAAGKDPTKLPIIVEAYAVVGDEAEAAKWAELWRFTPWAWNPFVNNPNPTWIRQQADSIIPLKEVYKNWTVSTDPMEHITALKKLWGIGVTHVQVHSPQGDQAAFIKFYGDKVIPML